MLLEQIGLIAQITATIGVMVSLIFVGYQIRQNTSVTERNEHNATMAQWSVIRQAIATNRDLAELMTAGLKGEVSLDDADQLRLEQFLAEYAWASFQVWDRTQRGVFPKGTFESTGGTLFCAVLRSARGSAWWQSASKQGFAPPFVADVDAMLGN